MISIWEQRKLTKAGPSSTSLVLPKKWVDDLKKILRTDDITLLVFGKEFLVLEVNGLKIKDKKAQKLLRQFKEYFIDKKG